MAEKTVTQQQYETKEGQLVVPMDHPRTFDYKNANITAVSGVMYATASGKEAYIKQFIVTELSGTNNTRVWLQDSSGWICPPLNVPANTTVTWDVRPAACGPTHGTIYYETEAGARFYGNATLIVQIDPKRTQ